MCLISTDFSEQFQSGFGFSFGYGFLGYKIKQLVMNKMEQPTLPLSGKAKYLTSLYVSGKEAPQEEIKEKIRAALKPVKNFFYRSSEHNAFTVDKGHEEKEEYTSPPAGTTIVFCHGTGNKSRFLPWRRKTLWEPPPSRQMSTSMSPEIIMCFEFRVA
ncbi:hypothetical protein Tco_0800981 [Tanacetum coccineum]|uniref:Uncharacterized protein n=1 Tax=Tanacetum coccineum TaxID=301880 RepID=A0ABQ4ZZ34_9ASTR